MSACSPPLFPCGRFSFVFQVPFETRHLVLGDFAWVARERDPDFGVEPRELMLPYVVERKRTDDLWSSIKDRR